MALAGAASERIAEPLIALGHDVTHVSGPAAAQRELAAHDLLVVDAKIASGLPDACRRLRAAAPAGLPMIAVAHSSDVEERIALIEAGADDVLAEPLDAKQLGLLTEALLSRSRPTPAEAPAEPRPAAGAAGGPSRLICFAAAKGGVGTTTLAVNTAVALAARGLSVAIADLDFHHGQVAAHLDLAPLRTTAELAGSVSDQPGLADVALSHASGVVAYPAPARPDQAWAVGADEVMELVRSLRAAHRLLIIDAGSVPGSRALSLLGLADQSVIVVSPDIPGLRALSGMLAAMSDAGITGEQNLFVVNRTFAAQAIGRGDIERHLGVELALEVPFDGESCLRAVNEGQPVSTLNPRSPVSGAIGRLAALVVGDEAGDAAPEGSRRGLLGGLLTRRQQ